MKYKSSNMAENTASQNFVEKRYDNITKSQNDIREYRGLLLKNKMKILLISNPTTDESAASLDVNIGYLNDPDDLPGLAHFCEHMLFLGTEKYPEKNEYKRYLSQHGGSYNAATNMDHTNYYFSIHSENLEGALDRFAHFFIAPLFTEALTDLELNAVHLEHEANLANDTWRAIQLEKSSANPSHPFTKFGTGNKQTLEIIPKQKNINIREKLLEFHETYYSANAMALCVLGKESLDELEEMVIKLFSQVKNKDIEIPVWLDHPFTEEDFQHKWYIVPIRNTRRLNITFPLPDLRAHYKSMPAHYLGYLLGHEGKGSLLSALKAKGWCNSVISGKRQSARGFNFFNVIADLTEEGIQHVDDIILLTFQYINMLKKHGPVEWIYNEYKDIAEMNFRFMEKMPPKQYVIHLVSRVQDFPMEEILVVGNIIMTWDPDLIESITKYLVPEKVRIHVIGQLYESICNETEKWYGTKFKKEKIPKHTIDQWNNAGYNPDLQLPPKNEFIPKRFDTKPTENVTKFPVIIEDTPFMRLWFKQDDEFLVPKANLWIDFVSPLTYIDPLSNALTVMFMLLLRDASNEYTYAADLACLKFDTIISKYGITITIAGYDDKQLVFLEEILDKMINLKVDPKRFEPLKENYVRSLKNSYADPPYARACYYLTVLLSEQVWMKDELLKATSYLTVERMQEFIPQFLSKVHVECLIHGNVTKSEALETAKLIESKLANSVPQRIPLLSRHMILNREIRLEDGCNFLFEIENTFHKSSCVHVYYQTGLQSTESNMLLELLAQIISEPCFTTLRTKEQLGYILFSNVRRTDSVQGLMILVQSDKHPKYVEQRIDAFLHSMLETITNMSDEEFNRHKESLAVKRLEKPKLLNTLTNIFYNEISSQQYHFDRVNIEVAYLKTIEKADILKFYKNMLQRNMQHKLSVHIVSTIGDQDTTEKDASKSTDLDNSIVESFDYKKIDDIMGFRISQSLHPLLKPFSNIPRKGAHSSKL
ncbi:insulin degrading metalloproteinase isoform X2 [Megalopta genalis]|uniref:insulin degrading metalloproteinase isoform X2 n=3 Tax=Megalopta genalis TaxID=115081 RepID=UPI0014438870|nr:insulin-degrading enzyme [Megalopta genalis]